MSLVDAFGERRHSESSAVCRRDGVDGISSPDGRLGCVGMSSAHRR